MLLILLVLIIKIRISAIVIVITVIAFSIIAIAVLSCIRSLFTIFVKILVRVYLQFAFQLLELGNYYLHTLIVCNQFLEFTFNLLTFGNNIDHSFNLCKTLLYLRPLGVRRLIFYILDIIFDIAYRARTG